MSTTTQLLLAFVISLSVAHGCSCSEPTVQAAANRATVVFRGTITALKPSNKPYLFRRPSGTEKTVVFRVTRVWKGEVGRTFEMPAMLEEADCWGFAAPEYTKPGAELLVYALKVEREFYTGICIRTRFVRYAAKDFKELGPGQEPE